MSPFIRKNLWILEFVAMALMAYLLAKMSINLIMVKIGTPTAISTASSEASPSATPSSKSFPTSGPTSGADYDVIVARNIFDSENLAAGAGTPEASSKPEASTKPISGEPVETTLAVELLSTFSVGSGADSRSNSTLATKETGSDGEIFSVGESFVDGVQITKILFDRVVFSHDGRLEYVLLNDFTKAGGEGKAESSADRGKKRGKNEGEDSDTVASEEGGETAFTISRSEIDQALGDPAGLLKQIRAVPYNKDGKPSGLKITSVDKSGIFAKLGIKRGDVLEKVNGNVLSFDQGLDLFNSLKNESQFTIDVIRRGKSQTLQYDVQ